MGKQSPRYSAPREKHQSGCMSGLIRFFDFSQGQSTPKLLGNRRNGNSRFTVGYSRSRFKLLSDSDGKSQGKNDGNEGKESSIYTGKTSVKKLMEEEMFIEQQPKKRVRSAAPEKIKSDLEHGQLGNKQSCTCMHVKDVKTSVSLDSQDPCLSSSVDRYSHLDLVALMEEFCSQIHQRQEMHLQYEKGGECTDGQQSLTSVALEQLDKQLVEKHCILEEKLGEAAETFLNQKLTNTKQLTKDMEIRRSKQFMDALEILNSNRDLILKFLEDSNSLLVQHIQELRDAQEEMHDLKKASAQTIFLNENIVKPEQVDELVHHKHSDKLSMNNLFWRMVKSQSKIPPKDGDSPHDSNRVVLLKPNPAGSKKLEATASTRVSAHLQYGISNEGQGESYNSIFSLREIKRKLKYIMGESRKEHRRISMDGILHKIPCEGQGSTSGGKFIAKQKTDKAIPSKTLSHPEKTSDNGVRSEAPSVRNDDLENSTRKAVVAPQRREPNIYLEAKKHLSDMVSSENEDLDSSIKHVPGTLGSILTVPEYISSPIFSPGRDIDHMFVTAQMRFSFSDDLGIVSENVWKPKEENVGGQDLEAELQTSGEIKLQILDLNPDISEGLLPENTSLDRKLCSRGESSPEGGVMSVEDLEVTDSEFLTESDFLDCPSDPNSCVAITRSNLVTDMIETREEDGSSRCLSMESPISEDELSSSSLDSFVPGSSLIQEVEVVESIYDGPEWPSPVSVLQPFFLEDVSSPATTTSRPAELQIQPRRIHFEETVPPAEVASSSTPDLYLTTSVEDKKPAYEYVRAVLQASGLSWDKFSSSYRSSNQPLDPSLFDEVEVMSTQLRDDPLLLFDCINEVLLDLYERYFGCSPWVTFVQSNIRPVPMGNIIVSEVWEGIRWHLIPQPLPCTLDDIVGKDMTKKGTWMNLEHDIEVIGIEIEEAILRELIEEAIFNLCS